MMQQGRDNGSRQISVLTVDDDQSINAVYRQLLSRQGFTVETCTHARDALRILMRKSFDVLIVDLMMPEMDGVAFLNEATKIWPGLGVIVISGFVSDEVKEKLHSLGVTTIHHKPFSPGKLGEAVEKEALEARQRTAKLESCSLESLGRYIRLMSRIGEQVTGTMTLLDALREIRGEVAQLVPCHAIGMLASEEEEDPVMLICAEQKVHRDFLEEVREEMLIRYNSLSGAEINRGNTRLETEGEAPGNSGPSKIESVVSIPILLQDKIRGLLTLASAQKDAYSPTDVSILYHAASHISTTLATLVSMHRLAARDPLTGVLNRIGMERELQRAWAASVRYGHPLGVLIADLDHFKICNDSYGHSAGDEILREFCRIIERTCRFTDIVARYGGDEFIIILPGTDDEAARTFSERLLGAVRDHVFCEGTYNLRLSLTIGISTSGNSSSPATGAVILSQADRAMYMAKRAGRDRIWIWPEMVVGAREKTKTANTERKKERLDGSGGRILLVDDDEGVRDVICHVLRKDGHEVTPVHSVDSALETLDGEEEFDVLLTDLSMPVKSGMDLLSELAGNDSLVKVVMTGYATIDNAIGAMRHGAYDFIQKPIENQYLSALMKRALEYKRLKKDNERYQTHLEDMVKERSAQLAATLEEVRRSYEFTLEALVAMLDAREEHTGQHSVRARDMAVSLATCMGVDEELLDTVAKGALLHDIGKIGVRDSILLKDGPLSEEEQDTMHKHPQIGYNIVRTSPYLKDAAEIVLSHHERYDGTGYPRGLKGKEICVGARIFAIVDAYEAMRSKRVYREPLTPDEALKEIKKAAGTQFDPEIVDIFVKHREEIEKLTAGE